MKRYFKQIEELIELQLGQVNQVHSCGTSVRSGMVVRELQSIKGKVYLTYERIDKNSKCGFHFYCYRSASDTFNKDYIPIDYPSEFFTKSEAAFDIGLLKGAHAFAWSVLNDKLKTQFDGVFTGGEDAIENRIESAVTEAVDVIMTLLIPFLVTGQAQGK